MATPIHILLAEDSPGDANLARETLENSKILVDISVVVDGAQALDFLYRRPPYENVARPDLILLDLSLPKINGREVMTQIQGDEDLRSIPVVVLSSSDSEQDISKSYELGANCYVNKPTGIEAFKSIVRSVENFWFTVVRLP
jgi:two-component system response regulator